MTHASHGTGLAERPRDVFFVVCFAVFAFSSCFSDTLHALGRLQGEGFWADAHRWYAEVAGDRFFEANHLFLRISTGISGLVFGPFYLLLIYAFVTGANWIRIPALVYVGAMAHGMVEFLYWEYWLVGPRPEHGSVFLAFNLPYLVVPLLLALRMWREPPFGDGPPQEHPRAGAEHDDRPSIRRRSRRR